MNSGRSAYVVSLLSLAIFAACAKKEKPLPGRVYTGIAFGKPYIIDVVGDSTDFRAQIDSIIHIFEMNFNVNDPQSTISRYNAFQRTDTVFAFNDSTGAFGIVYDLTRDLNANTMQYYDPTVNPLKREWMITKMGGLLEPNLDSLYKFVGFDGAKMDLTELEDGKYGYKESYLRKADPRLEADFTTVAAAVAFDNIADWLKMKQVAQFRIKYGHGVIAHGFAVDTLNVIPLGIFSDSSDQRIRLQNGAFSYKNAEDKILLVDPTYGYPVENEMVYVAASAPSLAEAEVFSEAFMTMGFEKAADYYTKNDESRIQSFMFYTDQKVLRNASTEGFDVMIIAPDSTAEHN